jgi:hypothetical protein
MAGNCQTEPNRCLIGKLGQVDDVVLGLKPNATTPYAKKIAAVAQAMLGPEAGVICQVYPGCLGGIETVRRWRPLVRRRLSTRRPPGDAIRARNP